MSGALDFLDGLTTKVANIASQVVDIKGQQAVNRAANEARDQTPVVATSQLQEAPSKIPMEWIVGGGLVLIVVVLLARKG